MVDELRQAALRAVAAIAALEAQLTAGNRLWPDEEGKLAAARRVAQNFTADGGGRGRW